MEQYLCKDCSHFRQHYILDANSCTAIDCGHCVYPRLKHRHARAPACANFSLRAAPPPLPATRHFLSAEVLRWLRSLDLPPEVFTDLE